jgi:hypothetical protein
MSQRKAFVISISICLLFLLSVVFTQSNPTSAAVDLIYFAGHGEDGVVFLEWETATELDNQGFFILRLNQAGTYEHIGEFIPAEGEGATGAYYFYWDEDVEYGTGYWYQLESIDNNGHSEFEGPIQVIAGIEATDTPERTSTQTQTSTTSGSTGSTPTPTRTATRTPTRTRTPIQSTSSSSTFSTATSFFRFTTPTVTGNPLEAFTTPPTQSNQVVVLPTETLTPTATLIPLPEITMQFPTPPEGSDALDLQASEKQGSSPEGARRVWFTLERLIFLGFLLLVWVLLGGWFYLSYRRLE